MDKDVKFKVSLQVDSGGAPARPRARVRGFVMIALSRFVANFCRRVERAPPSESVQTKS